MAEDHGLSAAPVLVIDLRAVFRRDRVHRCLRFSHSGGRPDRPLGAIRTSNRPLNTKAYTRQMQARHGFDAHQRSPRRAPCASTPTCASPVVHLFRPRAMIAAVKSAGSLPTAARKAARTPTTTAIAPPSSSAPRPHDPEGG